MFLVEEADLLDEELKKYGVRRRMEKLGGWEGTVLRSSKNSDPSTEKRRAIAKTCSKKPAGHISDLPPIGIIVPLYQQQFSIEAQDLEMVVISTSVA